MDWTRTRSVLADLGKLLTCAICKSYLSDPCTLDNCDHNFCRNCIEESIGSNSKCPECGVFSWLKDLRLNHQLATTVNMTLKLQSLIGLNMEDIVPQSNSDSISETTFKVDSDEEIPRNDDLRLEHESSNKSAGKEKLNSQRVILPNKPSTCLTRAKSSRETNTMEGTSGKPNLMDSGKLWRRQKSRKLSEIAQSSTKASNTAVDHAKQPTPTTHIVESMDLENENAVMQEKNHATEKTNAPLHFIEPDLVNQRSRLRRNCNVQISNATRMQRSNSTNENGTCEPNEMHMTKNPNVKETSDTNDQASTRKSDCKTKAVNTAMVKDSSNQTAVKHAKQNHSGTHLSSRVTRRTGLKASKGNILTNSYLFRNRQNQQGSNPADKPLNFAEEHDPFHFTDDDDGDDEGNCNENQDNNDVIDNDQCTDSTDHDKDHPIADDHDNDNQNNHNGVRSEPTLRSKSMFFRKLACKTRKDKSNSLEMKQEDPFQFPGDDDDNVDDNQSILQLKFKSNKTLHTARKRSEEKSNLTALTQQDPSEFSDNNNDDDNDDGRPMLQLKSKSASKTLTKERKARRQKSNSFYFEHDKENSNGRLLRATTTKLRQKVRSEAAVEQSKMSSKFTHLKSRPINRKGRAVDGKKTSLKLNTKSKDPVVNEKRENATFNGTRKRARPWRNNIRGYFTAKECAQSEDTNSDIFSDDVSEMEKRKKWRKTSTSSSQSQKNVSVSSQSLKNKKGETPLHLAAIKGDLASARELINEGADPNAKDHAGWTPLHEACNHGHVEIVELLLDNGALPNIPGFDNDTPLHDAVANGRLKVVRLLVARGAILTARNKQGLLPMDYAITKAMKAALSPRESSTTQPAPALTMVTMKCSEFSRDSQVVLGTALNTQDQVLLKKCIKLLGGTLVDEFDESVTHIVTSVNDDGHCPRTIKYLSGILAGKWIVSFKWIKDCLQRRQWLDEDSYEVKGTCNTPRNARINILQQMPRLFDGCSFFLRGVFKPPTLSKGHLIKLITLGGGKVLHREPKLKDGDLMSLPSNPIVTFQSCAPEVAYHAPANSTLSCCTEFIIYDSASCDQQKVVHSPVLRTAPVTWLMDCISSFQLLNIPDA